jgi:hypothetical protein
MRYQILQVCLGISHANGADVERNNCRLRKPLLQYNVAQSPMKTLTLDRRNRRTMQHDMQLQRTLF